MSYVPGVVGVKRTATLPLGFGWSPMAPTASCPLRVGRCHRVLLAIGAGGRDREAGDCYRELQKA